MIEYRSWYFTAPWDPVPIRRGDPLGLRSGADYFADLLAPGLSNATSDARWISILSWCLKWSHVAWTNAGGSDLSGSDHQRARYAWLRPLELLWVDRTLESGQTTGQLRGRRSIERWHKAGRQAPNFAMSPDQFRRYRQVGTYGAYRVVLRTIPGLTKGDGWTPAATALALAKLVNDSLPSRVRLRQANFDKSTKWGLWNANKESRYWVERGWQTASAQTGGFLPTPDSGVSRRLPVEERRLLEPALFDSSTIRRITAEVLGNAKNARSHTDLCLALASSSAISKTLDSASISLLPAFSRFADAAMHAMRGIWEQINSNETKQAPTLKHLARSTELLSRIDRLRDAGAAWLRTPDRSVFPHDHMVTRLAEGMRNASSPIHRLQALARHHRERGGGRRWFKENGGRLVPLVADTGIAASDYRFRLRPLIRLAAQCGVANLKVALDAVGRSDFNSGSRYKLEEEEEGDDL